MGLFPTGSYAYDVHDNQVLMIDANSSKVASTYDRADRLTRRDIVPAPGVSAATTLQSYQYDGLSRLVRAEDDDSFVQWTHDSLSNVMQETQNGRVLTCTHDAVGNELSSAYPGGRTITCAYDALDRKQIIIEASQAIATYDYFGARRVERRQCLTPTPTIASSYIYDSLGRVTLSEHTPQQYPFLPITQQTYSWDAASNKTGRNDPNAYLSWYYTYDFAHRLIATLVTNLGGAVRNTTYALDGAGNRTFVAGDDCSGSYLLDAATPEPADSQVNQYTATPCEPGGSRGYDHNGNLTAIVWSPTTSCQLTYDALDQIVSYLDATGAVTSYAYDALGRRIAQSTPAQTTHFYYHGDEIIEEQDALGATTATYVWGERSGELLQMRRGGTDFCYLEDEQGSVMAVVDGTGAAVERYQYGDFGQPAFLDPAGNPRTQSAIGNTFLFEAQRFDAESGFYLMAGRSLDPHAGRYVSRHAGGGFSEADSGNALTGMQNNPQTRGAIRGFNPQPDPPGVTRGFNPQPDPPGIIRGFNPQPDPPGVTRGFNPQPDPPGIIRGFNPQPDPPGVTRGFNPQPDPPGIIRGFNPQPDPPGIVRAFNPQPDPPGVTRGFNPQPDPPGIIRGFNPQPDPPGIVRAFNPQPDPPGVTRGFNPQPDPPGIIRGFNPQPDPPGRSRSVSHGYDPAPPEVIVGKRLQR